MGLIVATISNNPVVVLEGSAKFHGTVDLRPVLDVTVHDAAGTAVYQPGQPVTFTDGSGWTFRGYINDAKVSNITPNPNNLIPISCIGNVYLADRAYSLKDYENQFAGDILCDLASNYLAADGVTANYAIRRDTTQADFTQGTLSGTVAASNVEDGNLELAPAGSTVEIVENTTSVFGAGDLTAVTAANNTLAPTPINALKLSGTMNVPGISGAIANYKIWTGSHTIASTDDMQYFIWIDPASPEIKACIDVVCTDGTRLQDQTSFAYTDENDILPVPSSDLSGYANGQWYPRFFGLVGMAGKSIAYISVILSGQKVGTYTAYFNSIQIFNNATLATVINVFQANSTAPVASQQLGTVGYENISLSVVPTYDLESYTTLKIPLDAAANTALLGSEAHGRASTAYSIDAVKLLKNSLISWQATQPANTKLIIRCALDNGTIVECTNHAPLPNLVAGMNMASRTLTIYQDFYFLDKITSPESAPVLSGLEITLESAPSCTKSDATYTTSFSGSESGASFSSTIGNFSLLNMTSTILNLTGATRNWDLPIGLGNWDATQTTYLGTAGDSIFQRAYQFGNPSSAHESKTRFDFAGQHQNFIAEIDVQIQSDVSSGLIYRSTALSANTGSYAYAAMLSATAIVLKKGTNTTGGGSATTLTTVSLTLTANSWHRIKVDISGSTHKVYLDDVLQITKTDSSFSATGYLGVVGISPTQAYPTINFDNFGVMDALSGTWTSPNISLNSVASYGNSYISWRDRSESPTSNNTLLVEYTINGGTNWTTCTNGQSLTGLTAGQSLTGVNLKLRATLTTTTAQSMPGLDALYLLVTGAFSSSGSRISHSLDLSPASVAGSTLVSWTALQPTGTNIYYDTSIDNGSSWSQIGTGASGSAPIPGIALQPEPIDDTFDSNTSSAYTSSGVLGTAASWTWDTAHSRIQASGGNVGLLEYNSFVAADIDVMADLDQADYGGLVARVNGTTMYMLVLYDSQALTLGLSNVFFLYAIVSGSYTQLASASITFVRGTPHRFHLICQGSTITATMDGATLASVTDTSITAAGTSGLLGGSQAQFYQFRIAGYGQSISGISALSRVRMTSTDPTVTPQLTDLTVSAHNPNIQNGAFIAKANYSILSGNKNNLASCFDDLAKQSDSFIWDIDDARNLIFAKRSANLSPWIATGADIQLSPAPQIEYIADLYRNDQFGNGGIDSTSLTKSFIGDGETQTWTLDFPVDKLTGVQINNSSSFLIGIKGVDTGKDYYYTVGSPVISQDTAGLPLVNTQEIIFSYDAQVTIATEIRDDAAIAARAALDGTTGIVRAVEDCTGLSKIAMLQKTQGVLQENSKTSPETITFTTMRSGLAAYQILTVFLPQLNLNDAQMLITDASTTWRTTMTNNVEVAQPWYSISATSGPIVGQFERFLFNIAKGAASTI